MKCKNIAKDEKPVPKRRSKKAIESSNTGNPSESIDRLKSAFDYTSSDDELFDKKSTKTHFRRQRKHDVSKSRRVKQDSSQFNYKTSEVKTVGCQKSAKNKNDMQVLASCAGPLYEADEKSQRKKKTNEAKKQRFDPGLAEQCYTSKNCPVCNIVFPASISEDELNKHVNSCLDIDNKAKINAANSETNENNTYHPTSLPDRSDEELAKVLQRREEEEDFEEKLCDQLFFCSFCQKNLTNMNSGTRQTHMNRCADLHEKELLKNRKAEKKLLAKENGGNFECLICGLSFSNMKSRISHMKQCCKEQRVNRREILNLIKSEQENNQGNGKQEEFPAGEFGVSNQNEEKSWSESKTTANMFLKYPVNSFDGMKENAPKKKKIVRKKARHEVVPALLTRSEEEAKEMLARKAASLISCQLEMSDTKKQDCTLPPSNLAKKYESRKHLNGERVMPSRHCISSGNEDSYDQCPPEIIRDSQQTSKKGDKNSHLWDLAAINRSSMKLPDFYVRDVFHEDLVSTEKIMRKNSLERTSPDLPLIKNNAKEASSASELKNKIAEDAEDEVGIAGNLGKNTLSPKKVRGFEDSFTMTQLEKTAILDKLGEDCSADKRLEEVASSCKNEQKEGDQDATFQRSGFCTADETNERNLEKILHNHEQQAQDTLVKDMKLLLADETTMDIKILCCDGELKAHSLILRIRCPEIFKDAHKGIISIEESPKEIVQCLLKHLYTGALNVDANLAEDIAVLANRYSLKKLLEVCNIIRDNTDAIANPFYETKNQGNTVNVLIKSLWENVHTADNSNEAGSEEDSEENSEFDENDAEDLRHFYATQKEKKACGSTNEEQSDSETGMHSDIDLFLAEKDSEPLRERVVSDENIGIDVRDSREKSECESSNESQTVGDSLKVDPSIEMSDLKNEFDFDAVADNLASATLPRSPNGENHKPEVSTEIQGESICLGNSLNISFNDIPMISAEEVSQIQIVENDAAMSSFLQVISDHVKHDNEGVKVYGDTLESENPETNESLSKNLTINPELAADPSASAALDSSIGYSKRNNQTLSDGPDMEQCKQDTDDLMNEINIIDHAAVESRLPTDDENSQDLFKSNDSGDLAIAFGLEENDYDISRSKEVQTTERRLKDDRSLVFVSPSRGTPKVFENTFLTPVLEKTYENESNERNKSQMASPCRSAIDGKNKMDVSGIEGIEDQVENVEDVHRFDLSLSDDFPSPGVIEEPPVSPCVTSLKYNKGQSKSSIYQHSSSKSPRQLLSDDAINVEPEGYAAKRSSDAQSSSSDSDDVIDISPHKNKNSHGSLMNSEVCRQRYESRIIDAGKSSVSTANKCSLLEKSAMTSTPNKRKAISIDSCCTSDTDEEIKSAKKSPSKKKAKVGRGSKLSNNAFKALVKKAVDISDTEKSLSQKSERKNSSSASFSSKLQPTIPKVLSTAKGDKGSSPGGDTAKQKVTQRSNYRFKSSSLMRAGGRQAKTQASPARPLFDSGKHKKPLSPVTRKTKKRPSNEVNISSDSDSSSSTYELECSYEGTSKQTPNRSVRIMCGTDDCSYLKRTDVERYASEVSDSAEVYISKTRTTVGQNERSFDRKSGSKTRVYSEFLKSVDRNFCIDETSDSGASVFLNNDCNNESHVSEAKSSGNSPSARKDDGRIRSHERTLLKKVPVLLENRTLSRGGTGKRLSVDSDQDRVESTQVCTSSFVVEKDDEEVGEDRNNDETRDLDSNVNEVSFGGYFEPDCFIDDGGYNCDFVEELAVESPSPSQACQPEIENMSDESSNEIVSQKIQKRSVTTSPQKRDLLVDNSTPVRIADDTDNSTNFSDSDGGNTQDASDEESDTRPVTTCASTALINRFQIKQSYVAVERTPNTALRNFGPGCTIHPETKLPITPMSDYAALDTPVLTKRVKGFGMRKLPKRQMVGKLKEIFKMQHGFKHWEEEPPKLQRKKKKESVTKKKKEVITKKKKEIVSKKDKLLKSKKASEMDTESKEDNHSDGYSSSDNQRRKTFEGPIESDDDLQSQSSQIVEEEENIFDKMLSFIKDREDL